ncbi:hypothetical protein OFO01_07625 [Campylobacter sp. JMF_01 NE2]|uniref:hypothetical protein n=1 Tax=unclassified Campylobacter TaxID=2593542 RepID=UPI0022E9D811|nr:MULTISPECIES: hypothetical protein [unclassified Campylobacter]MDA3053328.1 hypothetical protein [Campylobacter sp. JMF_03 NE3]MDA3067652.1 hypothetical protein [Campylobacter sp. JMF_01 NE2]
MSEITLGCTTNNNELTIEVSIWGDLFHLRNFVTNVIESSNLNFAIEKVFNSDINQYEDDLFYYEIDNKNIKQILGYNQEFDDFITQHKNEDFFVDIQASIIYKLFSSKMRNYGGMSGFLGSGIVYLRNKILENQNKKRILISYSDLQKEYTKNSSETDISDAILFHKFVFICKEYLSRIFNIDVSLNNEGLFIDIEPLEKEYSCLWLEGVLDRIDPKNSNVAKIAKLNVNPNEEREISIINMEWEDNFLFVNCIDVNSNIRFYFSVFPHRTEKEFLSEKADFNFYEFKQKSEKGKTPNLLCVFRQKRNSGYLACVSARLKTE